MLIMFESDYRHSYSGPPAEFNYIPSGPSSPYKSKFFRFFPQQLLGCEMILAKTSY